MEYLGGEVYTIFAFPAEFLAAELIFLMGQKKRPLFWGRFAFFVSVCAMTAYFWPDSSNLWLNMGRYFAIFLVNFAGIFLCFRLPVQTVGFYLTAAYAVQHSAYLIGGWISYFISADSVGSYYLQHTSVYALVYLIFWVFLYPHLKTAPACRIEGKRLLFLSAALLTITLILNYVRVIYGQGLNFPMDTVCTSYALISCALALALQFGFLSSSKLEQEVAVIERLWETDKKNYQLANENLNLIHAKCHDMKHFLKMVQNEEQRKEMEEAIGIYDSLAQTGNTVLDTILSQKALYCQQHGITLTCMADGEAVAFMDTMNLYSIFGNLIDNAVESVIEIADPSMRIIGLTVVSEGAFVCIHTENYYAHELTFHDGLPLTTKKDSNYHGYGLKSVRMLAEKYGGYMKIHTEEGIFSLDLLIPQPPK